MLKTVKFTNFKSLSSKSIHLGNFNVLVGANAAGKSNFVDALKFIKDVNETDLYNAVGTRLGWENTLTRGLNLRKPIAMEFHYDFSDKSIKFRMGKRAFNLNQTKHVVEFSNTGRRLIVNKEEFTSLSVRKDQKFNEHYDRTGSRVKIDSAILYPRERPVRQVKIPPQFEADLFLGQGFFTITSDILSDIINMWRFYHLDVQSARRSCIDTGENYLQPDGCNLALILDKMRKSSIPRIRNVNNRILRLMSTLVPQFSRWKAEHLFDGSIAFRIFEDGISKPLLPAMISDGTIRLLSILVSLLYQPKSPSMICIDEPERYLHPQVLEPLIEIMREVSKDNQIIITTHSPELVRLLKPEEVLLVDKVANTTHLVSAASTQMIHKFLKEFTLDELWLSGYLKGGKAF